MQFQCSEKLEEIISRSHILHLQIGEKYTFTPNPVFNQRQSRIIHDELCSYGNILSVKTEFHYLMWSPNDDTKIRDAKLIASLKSKLLIHYTLMSDFILEFSKQLIKILEIGPITGEWGRLEYKHIIPPWTSPSSTNIYGIQYVLKRAYDRNLEKLKEGTL